MILASLLFVTAVNAAPVEAERLNKNGVALCPDRNSSDDAECYDPVSYIDPGRAEKAGAVGSRSFREKFKSATYVFNSAAHRDSFKKSPEKYIPQYGGWCAYAVAEKKQKVDIDPRSFHVQDGRILLFYDGLFADTRKTWLHDKAKDPAAYLKSADTNWPMVESQAPE